MFENVDGQESFRDLEQRSKNLLTFGNIMTLSANIPNITDLTRLLTNPLFKHFLIQKYNAPKLTLS